jgi:hypothetical protein
MVRVLAIAATLTLAGCQALWDLPNQMREPYGSTGSPPAAVQNQAIQTEAEEECLP